jgi:RNA polymerase sigma-70 factor, ECF subfamily
MGEGTVTACKLTISTSRAQSPNERLEALVAGHHAFVWRSLRRLGVPDQDVDDASQQGFLVAFRRLSDIAVESERSFLFQTALRVAADRRRAHRRRCEQPGLDLQEFPDSEAMSPEELMDRRRARALFDKVLAAMPLDLRAVFVLFELEDMTMAEIATMADIPAGTVASRLRRARRQFQKAASKIHTTQGAQQGNRGVR